MTKWRRVAAASGLLALALVVSLLLVEVVLRVYASTADTSLAQALRVDPYAVKVEPHGEVGYRPRPNTTFGYSITGAHATTNARGYRGPVVSVPKPERTIRVVLLGGSTTFGWGVNDGQTIDAHMREMLEAQRLGPDVEVVNLGFDGYDSYQLLERLRSDGLALEPDFIIVNSGVNDVRNAWYRDIRDGDPRTLLYGPTLRQLRFEEALGRPTMWSMAKHWLHLARVPGWARGEWRRSRQQPSAERAPRPEFHWDALDYFERNIARIVDLGLNSGSTAVLLSTPPSTLLTRPDSSSLSYWLHDNVSTQVYRDSLSARLKGLVKRRAKQGEPVAYVQHDTLPEKLFLDDAHLTSAGNRAVARDFVEALHPWLGELRDAG